MSETNLVGTEEGDKITVEFRRRMLGGKLVSKPLFSARIQTPEKQDESVFFPYPPDTENPGTAEVVYVENEEGLIVTEIYYKEP